MVSDNEGNSENNFWLTEPEDVYYSPMLENSNTIEIMLIFTEKWVVALFYVQTNNSNCKWIT